MIVRTPQLRNANRGLVSKSSDESFFCLGPLQREIDVPDAAAYWGEASDKQWPDKSGLKVEVRVNVFLCAWYKTHEMTGFSLLWATCTPSLRQLGCVPDGPAKTIYFRLVYEE